MFRGFVALASKFTQINNNSTHWLSNFLFSGLYHGVQGVQGEIPSKVKICSHYLKKLAPNKEGISIPECMNNL